MIEVPSDSIGQWVLLQCCTTMRGTQADTSEFTRGDTATRNEASKDTKSATFESHVELIQWYGWGDESVAEGS